MVKAPLLRRLLAWVVDAIIMGIIIIIVLLCTSLGAILNLVKEGTSLTLTLYSLIELVQVGLIIEILFILYYISIPIRNHGQTFCKKMLKIR